MFRILVVSLLLVACAGSPAATPSAAPTVTPAPTGAPTVAPTASAAPATATPEPTTAATAEPTPAATATQPVVITPPPGAQIVIPLDPSGAFLVTPDGYSLYTFDADDVPGESACYDDCAGNWPPFTTGGLTVGGGDGVSGTFASINRTDGTVQVTYNDAPLYFYVGDASPGDTNGDGLGDVWHLAAP